MGKASKLVEGVSTVVGICSNKEFQKMLFGTYSDGHPRSLLDAVNGEILSPKQKKKKLYKKRKNGKKKIRL